jgi:hypothetical protein
LPIRGGFVDADAHDGGAERAEKTSPDASSSSVSFRWTTRGRARVASAVVVAPPVALEARGSVARPRRVERRDGSSHRPDATPTGSDVVIGDAAGPIRGDARDLVGTVRPCAPRNACPARAQPRVVVETLFARSSSWLKERRNWWLRERRDLTFRRDSQPEKTRFGEKIHRRVARAPEAFPFALRRASETLVTEEPPPTRLEEARVFLAGRVMYKIVSRVSIVSSSHRLIVSRKVIFPLARLLASVASAAQASTYPFEAASRRVVSVHGAPFSRAHFSVSRWPSYAALEHV